MRIVVFLTLAIIQFNLNAKIVILYGEKATDAEINASRDLVHDIQKGYPNEDVLLKECSLEEKFDYDHLIIVGTKATNKLIHKFCIEDQSLLLKEDLEPETFILESKVSGENKPVLYIIGADIRGTYYGVYEFSRTVIGIDPFEYWTEKKPVVKGDFNIPSLSYREDPPLFPLRGYFDNDNDMLANWKGRKLIVEFDIWKEIINSLARLRYNYIDIHDLLGRTEYYEWDYYKNLTDYHTDLELVEQVIDYAHSKGMLVQIPMYLGWEFHHMDLEKVCLSEHMDHWMEIYDYYLTQSPLGKGDLFLQRPRHPYYDWAYMCEDEIKKGIKPGPLLTEMFNKLHVLIKEHNSEAILFCDLWREGRPMWQSGEFAPDKDIQMLWADYGVADFREWPEDFLGYDFGVYIHAGVWKNHVMQDPYPAKIKEATIEAVERNMNNNYLVNGQDFKHFILNLEACAIASWDPYKFDPEKFYHEWTTRYFGENVSAEVVKSLKVLHEAHQPVGGFRDIMAETVEIIRDLNEKKIIYLEIDSVLKALDLASVNYLMAVEIEKSVQQDKLDVFDDQILFPARIFKENLELLKAAVEYNNVNYNLENSKPPATNTAREEIGNELLKRLKILRASLDKGSRFKKWEGWTKCENFRVYTPPPQIQEVEALINMY